MKTIKYEVWALGYNKDGFAIDAEKFFGSFQTKEAAQKFAREITKLEDVYTTEEASRIVKVGDILQIAVETVVETEFYDTEKESLALDVEPINEIVVGTTENTI